MALCEDVTYPQSFSSPNFYTFHPDFPLLLSLASNVLFSMYIFNKLHVFSAFSCSLKFLRLRFVLRGRLAPTLWSRWRNLQRVTSEQKSTDVADQGRLKNYFYQQFGNFWATVHRLFWVWTKINVQIRDQAKLRELWCRRELRISRKTNFHVGTNTEFFSVKLSYIVSLC